MGRPKHVGKTKGRASMALFIGAATGSKHVDNIKALSPL